MEDENERKTGTDNERICSEIYQCTENNNDRIRRRRWFSECQGDVYAAQNRGKLFLFYDEHLFHADPAVHGESKGRYLLL